MKAGIQFPDARQCSKSPYDSCIQYELDQCIQTAEVRQLQDLANSQLAKGEYCSWLQAVRAAQRVLDNAESLSDDSDAAKRVEAAATFLFHLLHCPDHLDKPTTSNASCSCRADFQSHVSAALAAVLESGAAKRHARKLAIAVLRIWSSRGPAQMEWSEFCDLVEVLEEPQSHIVAPVLATFHSLGARLYEIASESRDGTLWYSVPPSAVFILAAYGRALCHANGWIRLWVIRKLIDIVVRETIPHVAVFDTSKLLELVLPRLSDIDIWNRLIEKNILDDFLADTKLFITLVIGASDRIRTIHFILSQILRVNWAPSPLYFYSDILVHLAKEMEAKCLNLSEVSAQLLLQVFNRVSCLCMPDIRMAVQRNLFTFATKAFSLTEPLEFSERVARISPMVSALPGCICQTTPGSFMRDLPSFEISADDWLAIGKLTLENGALPVLCAFLLPGENLEHFCVRMSSNMDGGEIHFILSINNRNLKLATVGASTILLLGALPDSVIKEFGDWLHSYDHGTVFVQGIVGPIAMLTQFSGLDMKGKYAFALYLCVSAARIWQHCSASTEHCADAVDSFYKYLNDYETDTFMAAVSVICVAALSAAGVAIPPVTVQFALRWTDNVKDSMKNCDSSCRELYSLSVTSAWELSLKTDASLGALLQVADCALPVVSTPAEVTRLLSCMADADLKDINPPSTAKWADLLCSAYSSAAELRKCIEYSRSLAAWLRLSRKVLKTVGSALICPLLDPIFDNLMDEIDSNPTVALLLAKFFMHFELECDQVGCLWSAGYLVKLALYGPALSKAHRVNDYAERRIFDRAPQSQFHTSHAEGSTEMGWIWQRVRATSIAALVHIFGRKKMPQEVIVTKLMTHVDQLLSLKKARTCSIVLGLGHRVRTRTCLVLLALLPHIDVTCCATVLACLTDFLIIGGQQPSIRLLCEIGMSMIFLSHCTLMHERMWTLDRALHAARPATVSSWIAVLMHVAIARLNRAEAPSQAENVGLNEESVRDLWERAYIALLPWRAAQNFVARTTALAASRRMFSSLDRCMEVSGLREKYHVLDRHLMSPLEASGSQARQYDALLVDFYFGHFDLTHFNYATLFNVYMKQCGMPDDEQIPMHIWKELLASGVIAQTDSMSLEPQNELSSLPSAWMSVHIEHDAFLPPLNTDPSQSHHRDTGDFQHKITTSTQLCTLLDQLSTDGGDSAHKAQRRRTELIVVASLVPVPDSVKAFYRVWDCSLIDRPANLGGLCRSCEVFGAKQMVVASAAIVEKPEFTALSVSAESWVDVVEVRPVDLANYLSSLRTEQNYMIVGVEQTAHSVPLHQFDFGNESKIALVLGRERTGIPADLISALDRVVEIGQLGVVRSLNVHSAALLVMYEYVRKFVWNK